jgi:hypothetical protein
MGDWRDWWPWGRRHRREDALADAVGEQRQEQAVMLATIRQKRRSLDDAVREMIATQRERGDDD